MLPVAGDVRDAGDEALQTDLSSDLLGAAPGFLLVAHRVEAELTRRQSFVANAARASSDRFASFEHQVSDCSGLFFDLKWAAAKKTVSHQASFQAAVSLSSDNDSQQDLMPNCSAASMFHQVSSRCIRMLLILFLCVILGAYYVTNEKRMGKNNTICPGVQDSLNFNSSASYSQCLGNSLPKSQLHLLGEDLDSAKRLVQAAFVLQGVDFMFSICCFAEFSVTKCFFSLAYSRIHMKVPYNISESTVLTSALCSLVCLVPLPHITTNDAKFLFNLVKAITWRSTTQGEIKQDSHSLCCHLFEEWLEGVHIEDVTASPFGLYHRRQVRVSSLLVLRFNGEDFWNLSSVTLIPYLQLRSLKRQVHMPIRPLGEPPGILLASTFAEALKTTVVVVRRCSRLIRH